MSYNDAIAKLRWYQLRTMESPLGSEERAAWSKILREFEGFVHEKTATAGTVTA